MSAGQKPSTLGAIAYLLFGPIVWALHFAVLYSVQSTLCSLKINASVLGLDIIAAIVILATLLALMLLGIAALRADVIGRYLSGADRPTEQSAFHRRVMVTLTILAIFAVASAGATAAFVDTCSALR